MYFILKLKLPNGTVAQLLDIMDYISKRLPDAVHLTADQYSDRLGCRA